MITGIGTDIIEISRVRDLAARQPRLLARVLTEAERQHVENGGRMKWARAAGKFAAKEAVAKAFGRPLAWHDVEVLPDGGGKPSPVLHGSAAGAALGLRLHVSISHGREYAIAVAVLEEG